MQRIMNEDGSETILDDDGRLVVTLGAYIYQCEAEVCNHKSRDIGTDPKVRVHPDCAITGRALMDCE